VSRRARRFPRDLGEEARAKGTVYSIAIGDQPALTGEIVDAAWPAASRPSPTARAPSTCCLPLRDPDEVWGALRTDPEEAKREG